MTVKDTSATMTRIKPAIKRKLQQIATANGRSLSSQIAIIIQEWMRANTK